VVSIQESDADRTLRTTRAALVMQVEQAQPPQVVDACQVVEPEEDEDLTAEEASPQAAGARATELTAEPIAPPLMASEGRVFVEQAEAGETPLFQEAILAEPPSSAPGVTPADHTPRMPVSSAAGDTVRLPALVPPEQTVRIARAPSAQDVRPAVEAVSVPEIPVQELSSATEEVTPQPQLDVAATLELGHEEQDLLQAMQPPRVAVPTVREVAPSPNLVAASVHPWKGQIRGWILGMAAALLLPWAICVGWLWHAGYWSHKHHAASQALTVVMAASRSSAYAYTSAPPRPAGQVTVPVPQINLSSAASQVSG
jgi:hypothetical protein